MSDFVFTRLLGFDSKEPLVLWPNLCSSIDEVIDSLNLELSEEKIFFQWDNLLQINQYFVGRPVVGVVKELPDFLRMKEFALPKTPEITSESRDWDQLLTELRELRIEVFFID